jgi:hypothetical protein
VSEHRLGDVVADAATLDILRDNPFRVLGLPTDASAQDIRRAAQRLKVEQGLADGDGDGNSADRVEEAQRRLRDPDQRLVAELLAPWPEDVPGADTQGAALDALTRFVEGEQSAATFRAASQAIATALDDPRVTEHLVNRVAELGDPRLTEDDARELVGAARLLLPLLALGAARDSHGDHPERARILAEAVHDVEQGSDALRRAERIVVGPAIARVREAADGTTREALSDPGRGTELATGLLDGTEKDRVLVRLLLGEGSVPQRAVPDSFVTPFRSVLDPLHAAGGQASGGANPQRVAMDDSVAQATLTAVIAHHNQAQAAITGGLDLVGTDLTAAASQLRTHLDAGVGDLRVLERLDGQTEVSPSVQSRLDENLAIFRASVDELRSAVTLLDSAITQRSRAGAAAATSGVGAGRYGASTGSSYPPPRWARTPSSTRQDPVPQSEEASWGCLIAVIIMAFLVLWIVGAVLGWWTDDSSSSLGAATDARDVTTVPVATTGAPTTTEATTTTAPTTTTTASTTTTTAPPPSTAAPALAVGACARPVSPGQLEYTEVACDDPAAEVRLIEKFPGYDPNSCPPGTDVVLEYTESQVINGVELPPSLRETWCMQLL